MTEVAHRLSTSKSTDDVTNILHRTIHMKFTCELTWIENLNVEQLGRNTARHDHLAWSEDPPFLRELYSLFPKYVIKE
uniref:SFRICE_015395 n=1 Tax=Spodoptera frugiperda TaxID=7108 RepID=A0A2H1VUI6_SPOFR